MNRKGIGWEEIVGIAALLLIFFFFVSRFSDSNSYFSKALTCPAADVEYACRSAAEGCGSIGDRAYSKFKGCGETEICCRFAGGAPGKTASTTGSVTPTDIKYLGPIIFTATDSATLRPIADRSTFTIYAEQDKKVLLKLTLPECKDCMWHYEGFHLNKAEQKITIDNIKPYSTKDGGEHPVSATELASDLASINLVKDPSYIGETITYKLLITPVQGTGKNAKEGTTQIFSFRYKVTSPVTVTPLSSEWQKSKQAIASCDPSIGCSAIFYTIQTNSSDCAPFPAVAVKSVKSIPVSYCMYQNGKVGSCSYSTLQSCNAAADTTDTSVTARWKDVLAAAQQSGLTDAQWNLFTSSEQQVSNYQCKMDLSANEGDQQYLTRDFGTGFTPLNITFNRERQQATINLDRGFMSERYLCVYGQSEHDPNTVWVAGKPQLIKIDTVPPVATLKYDPLTKRITFSCTDDKSGCKPTYWVQYISDVTKFLPALGSGGGQSASIWCPAYETASGWRIESKSQVLYSGNDVRVLCLRVEDVAGNAGITKTTVYNGYAVLQEFINQYKESN